MKIYRIMSEPLGFRDYPYFCADERSDYISNACKKCGKGGRIGRRHPARVERLSGSTCADFYSAVDFMVVSESVGRIVKAEFGEVETLPLIVTNDASDCEPVLELWPWAEVFHCLPESSAKIGPPCSVCGRPASFDVEWPEKTSTYDAGRNVMAYRIVKTDAAGLYIPWPYVNQSDIFLFGPFLLCTDRFKAFVEENHWTNIMFIHAGEVVS